MIFRSSSLIHKLNLAIAPLSLLVFACGSSATSASGAPSSGGANSSTSSGGGTSSGGASSSSGGAGGSSSSGITLPPNADGGVADGATNEGDGGKGDGGKGDGGKGYPHRYGSARENQECEFNSDCGMDLRCEGTNAGSGPIAVCKKGERGESVLGDPCQDGNACGSSICLDNQCSDVCTSDSDCNKVMPVCKTVVSFRQKICLPR
jgi:hypothetical protein